MTLTHWPPITRGKLPSGTRDGDRQARGEPIVRATKTMETNPTTIQTTHHWRTPPRGLPPGRRRVAQALIADSASQTYPAVAAQLGIHLGTVHQHLRRLRLRHPQVYAVVMAERARQLAQRHERAVLRAAAHSEAWHRKQAKRRFFY